VIPVRLRLTPRETVFYDLFTASADNLLDGARVLQRLVTGSQVERAALAKELLDLEHRGDDRTHSIMREVNSTFVTPFDREDIHALTEELDDVVDDIHAAADLLMLHHVDTSLPEMRELAGILVNAADANRRLVAKLPRLRGLEPELEEIDRLESAADSVYRRSVARLFSGEYKAFAVLKWKDIVEALENSVNAIEDISDIVESIVLKHA
jgi:predicted phosphate transport protein (TIGR00153 family)